MVRAGGRAGGCQGRHKICFIFVVSCASACTHVFMETGGITIGINVEFRSAVVKKKVKGGLKRDQFIVAFHPAESDSKP